jgi:hypothetical protein
MRLPQCLGARGPAAVAAPVRAGEQHRNELLMALDYLLVSVLKDFFVLEYITD